MLECCVIVVDASSRCETTVGGMEACAFINECTCAVSEGDDECKLVASAHSSDDVLRTGPDDAGTVV